MEDEKEEINENPTIDASDDVDIDEFESEETSRDLVVPGEILTEDTKNFLPGRGTIFNKDRTKIISLNIGLKQVRRNYINVIPLRGFYTPRPGDKIIALVTDKNPVKYICDINSKDKGILKPKNTVARGKPRGYSRGPPDRQDNNTDKYKIGDILIVKVFGKRKTEISV